MKKRYAAFTIIFLLLAAVSLLLAACGSAKTPATSAGPVSASVSQGQTLMQDRCTVCHSMNRITSAHKTAGQWKATVEQMIGKGAQLSSSEEQTLIGYLAQNYK